MPSSGGGRGQLAETVRIEGARILATFVRAVGDLQLAEDAVQEAVLAALKSGHGLGYRHCRAPGSPPPPGARPSTCCAGRGARAAKEREGADLMELSTPDTPPDSVVRDDQLRLIITCCHA